MESSKLLLISCYFPPAGGIHVLRALSLAKYLPQNGFEVHVLTTRNPAVPIFDPALLNQVPRTVQIHRTWTLEPPFKLRKTVWRRLNTTKANTDPNDSHGSSSLGRMIKKRISTRVTHLLSPDPQILWYPLALRRASQLIRDKGITIVIVTAPPFSTFLMGCELKVRFPDICLISDFRDEWLTYFSDTFAFRGNPVVHRRAAEIEMETVKQSARVIAVTPTVLQSLRTRYSREPESKFRLVPNGFDPDSFVGFHSRSHKTDRIVVTYVGSIYAPCSPEPYLDALDRLPAYIRDRFETRFVGRLVDEFDKRLLVDRRSVIRSTGFVPHEEAIRYMEETDYLLFPLSQRLSVPGKLYEYLASGKPILALVPPGSDAEKIVKQTGSGWCIDGHDISAIAQLLSDICEVNGERYPRPNWSEIQKYERPRTVAAYSEIIREAVSSPKTAPKDAECLDPTRRLSTPR